MSPTTLVVNGPKVVHETIDGETILIHLGTGTYYSLDGVGAEIWTLVMRGLDAEQIAAELRSAHPEAGDSIAADVSALLSELVDEGLLQTGDGDRNGSAGAPAAQDVTTAAYAAPVLHRYTDMQEFMLADPLHDVDEEAGWPHVKAG